MIVSLSMLQLNNHSSIECRTNYRVKLNFINIKKIEGISKFFFKDRQIKFFKLLYINIFFQVRVVPDLRVGRPCLCVNVAFYSNPSTNTEYRALF